MEDQQIIALLFACQEQALEEIKGKYGRFCYSLALRLLGERQDAMECENDTYLAAWNAIPPQRPVRLRAFLGGITRNLALNRLRRQGTQRRGGGEAVLSLEELGECIGSGFDAQLEVRELTGHLNDFLAALPRQQRCGLLRPAKGKQGINRRIARGNPPNRSTGLWERLTPSYPCGILKLNK